MLVSRRPLDHLGSASPRPAARAAQNGDERRQTERRKATNSGQSLVIVGAGGRVAGEALALAPDQPEVARVTSSVRARRTGRSDRLREGP